jgi:hypothetical protein
MFYRRVYIEYRDLFIFVELVYCSLVLRIEREEDNLTSQGKQLNTQFYIEVWVSNENCST